MAIVPSFTPVYFTFKNKLLFILQIKNLNVKYIRKMEQLYSKNVNYKLTRNENNIDT